jgi:hypothetical protein
MPVILITQEAEIRRIEIQGLPWQIKRLYIENTTKKKKMCGGLVERLKWYSA